MSQMRDYIDVGCVALGIVFIIVFVYKEIRHEIQSRKNQDSEG